MLNKRSCMFPYKKAHLYNTPLNSQGISPKLLFFHLNIHFLGWFWDLKQISVIFGVESCSFKKIVYLHFSFHRHFKS